MKECIQTVGLIGKLRQESIVEPIRRLARFLDQRGLTSVLDEDTARLLGEPRATTRPLDRLGRDIDLAIVIGGDGTMLHIARNLAAYDVPLIGVNQGRLGFLTDVSVDDMEQAVGDILNGDFETERRQLLAAEVVRQERTVHTAQALNDVTLAKGELARLIEFETYLNGEFLHSTRGDGLVVATPTGSTAYALSAGGPIVHPTLPAIVLAPICPHTLTNRPIVVSSDATIEIVLAAEAEHAHLTFDGQSNYLLEDRDRIYVRRAPHTIELVHPAGRSHYGVLRAKLHWGKKY